MRTIATLAAALLAACGGADSEPPPAPAAPESAAIPDPNPPATAAEPSYEVAIAIAAANRNRAQETCDARPPRERDACRADVDEQWEIAKSALEEARGLEP